MEVKVFFKTVPEVGNISPQISQTSKYRIVNLNENIFRSNLSFNNPVISGVYDL